MWLSVICHQGYSKYRMLLTRRFEAAIYLLVLIAFTNIDLGQGRVFDVERAKLYKRETFCLDPTDESLKICMHRLMPAPDDICALGCSITVRECWLRYPHFLYQEQSSYWCGCWGCWNRGAANYQVINCDDCDEPPTETQNQPTEAPCRDCDRPRW